MKLHRLEEHFLLSGGLLMHFKGFSGSRLKQFAVKIQQFNKFYQDTFAGIELADCCGSCNVKNDAADSGFAPAKLRKNIQYFILIIKKPVYIIYIYKLS